jgi:hypothetical protein
MIHHQALCIITIPAKHRFIKTPYLVAIPAESLEVTAAFNFITEHTAERPQTATTCLIQDCMVTGIS